MIDLRPLVNIAEAIVYPNWRIYLLLLMAVIGLLATLTGLGAVTYYVYSHLEWVR